ncbi:MAG: AraC family transcriptional regulator [Deltaproteobacteria bacterium]|nr:AraC family transcriptional regulator [Deltaproteobacteria bacterium]
MRENRAICHDPALAAEVVSFRGILQKFPNHFHDDHYVVGCVEGGARRMYSLNTAYTLGPGDLVLFAPGDTHACEALDGKRFTYHCFNVRPETMRGIAMRTLGDVSATFVRPSVRDNILARSLADLARAFVSGADSSGLREPALALLEKVLAGYSTAPPRSGGEPFAAEVDAACVWMRRHFMEPVTLERLGHVAGCNKFTLVRAFGRIKGITPHRYLETVRVSAARAYLERGGGPAWAAAESGFTDQSHLSRHFKQMTGLTPGQYRRIFGKTLTGESARR